jgi:hypothetical protein
LVVAILKAYAIRLIDFVLTIVVPHQIEGAVVDLSSQAPFVRWRDALRHILADEAHHRDVNHTYAELQVCSIHHTRTPHPSLVLPFSLHRDHTQRAKRRLCTHFTPSQPTQTNKGDAENPFVHEHMRNFDDAVARRAPELLKQALERSLGAKK